MKQLPLPRRNMSLVHSTLKFCWLNWEH